MHNYSIEFKLENYFKVCRSTRKYWESIEKELAKQKKCNWKDVIKYQKSNSPLAPI